MLFAAVFLDQETLTNDPILMLQYIRRTPEGILQRHVGYGISGFKPEGQTLDEKRMRLR